MNIQQFKGPDPARSHLRAAVLAMDCELSALKQTLPGESRGTTGRLIEDWKELVALLALGPEPEYRECPFCGNTGIRSATRCGFCWRKLPPFVSRSEA